MNTFVELVVCQGSSVPDQRWVQESRLPDLTREVIKSKDLERLMSILKTHVRPLSSDICFVGPDKCSQIQRLIEKRSFNRSRADVTT